MNDQRKSARRISKSLRPIFPENRGLGPNRRGRRKPCENCVALEQERDELKKVNRAWYSTGGMISVERISEVEQHVSEHERLEAELNTVLHPKDKDRPSTPSFSDLVSFTAALVRLEAHLQQQVSALQADNEKLKGIARELSQPCKMSETTCPDAPCPDCFQWLQAENKELSRHRVTLFKLLDSKAVVTHSDIRACFPVDGDGLHFDPDLVPIIPPIEVK